MPATLPTPPPAPKASGRVCVAARRRQGLWLPHCCPCKARPRPCRTMAAAPTCCRFRARARGTLGRRYRARGAPLPPRRGIGTVDPFVSQGWRDGWVERVESSSRRNPRPSWLVSGATPFPPNLLYFPLHAVGHGGSKASAWQAAHFDVAVFPNSTSASQRRRLVISCGSV